MIARRPGPPGARLPAHVATTRHLAAAYPLMCESAAMCRGAYVGRDVLGGPFAFDPFERYASGELTNPNMVVFGQIGRGKSAFVKTMLWRQRALGAAAWVLDPKGEYAPLAAACGTTPVALAPGGRVRLNPLDVEDGLAPGDAARRRLTLLASLAEASLGRDLLPRERAALGAGLAQVGWLARPCLPEVVDAILAPDEAGARDLACSTAQLAADGRDVALELRRLVHGDLGGMFDGPTTPGLDLSADVVVLDLSAVYRSAALGVMMACAGAWMQGAIASGGRRHTFLVVDEAWAVLANLGVARWLQSTWKLSRAFGVGNVAVLHRLSDLQAVGAAGSEQAGLAAGLLADSETRVVYGQPPGEAERAAGLLDLNETEVALVDGLGRGVALWKVGRRASLVEHRLGPGERALVDTDAAMRPTGVVGAPGDEA